MRALKIFLGGIFAVVLVGCAGYHLGPVNGATAGEKSIEVLPFNNQTLQPRLGDALTQALRERIQTDATFHLATHGPGDIVLTGVIRTYKRQGIGYLSTDAVTAEDFRVEVIAHITARDAVSGKLLLDKDVKGQTLVHVGSDLASAERQALPLLAADLAQNATEFLTEGTW
jgi:Lipopolysaccharide-assembly